MFIGQLFSINLPWPKVEEFKSRSRFNDLPTVFCKTVRGKPDFVFIQLKHVQEKNGMRTTTYPPVIKTLKMEILGQDLKCISSLDEELIYHTTRKNSHHLSNVEQNYQHIGAVLLTKHDCGDFVQWQLLEGIDEFQVSVTVTGFEYAIDPPDGFHTDLDIDLSVYFIYSDYSIAGKPHEAVYGKNQS